MLLGDGLWVECEYVFDLLIVCLFKVLVVSLLVGSECGELVGVVLV